MPPTWLAQPQAPEATKMKHLMGQIQNPNPLSHFAAQVELQGHQFENKCRQNGNKTELCCCFQLASPWLRAGMVPQHFNDSWCSLLPQQIKKVRQVFNRHLIAFLGTPANEKTVVINLCSNHSASGVLITPVGWHFSALQNQTIGATSAAIQSSMEDTQTPCTQYML